jgi:hypothetical protein
MNRDKFKNTAYIVTSNSAPAKKIIPMCEELTGKKCAAYAGFTAKEFKNGELYKKKLAGFIDELKK